MKECCANCRRKYKIEVWNYSYPPYPRKVRNTGGYLCMAFAEEGTAIWMRGANEDRDLCECFEPKEEKK